MLDDYLQIKINKSRTCYDNYKKYQHTKFKSSHFEQRTQMRYIIKHMNSNIFQQGRNACQNKN